jgi:hypothetical protein
MTVAAASADYTTCITALRRCLAHGTDLSGGEKRLCLDVIMTAANTLDSKAAATVTAWADAQATALTAWNGAGSGDSSAIYTTQSALLITARAAAVTAAGASVTNVTQDDSLDGRAV